MQTGGQKLQQNSFLGEQQKTFGEFEVNLGKREYLEQTLRSQDNSMKRKTSLTRSQSHVINPQDPDFLTDDCQGAKGNAKNIFIQKIRGLLVDNDLRTKISIENTQKLVFLCKRPLEDKINSSKGIIKIGVGEEFTKELSCSRLSNKESARNSRMRKKLYIDLLEAKVQQLSQKNQLLTQSKFFSHQNLSQFTMFHEEEKKDDDVNLFKNLLNEIRHDSTPGNISSAWIKYSGESSTVLNQLQNEFVAFLDSSIHTINSTGYSPLFAIFLNSNSKNAKTILSKLDTSEKKVFQELLDLHDKKNKLESEFFKGLKNQAAKFFFQNKEHESQMKNLLKQIKKEKMVRLLNKMARFVPGSLEKETISGDEDNTEQPKNYDLGGFLNRTESMEKQDLEPMQENDDLFLERIDSGDCFREYQDSPTETKKIEVRNESSL